MLLFFLSVLSFISFSSSVEASAHMLEGGHLNLLWGLPFLGVLGSLALFPLIAPQLWHQHFGKITLLWSLLVIVPMGWLFGPTILLHEILVTYLLHYFPFIILAGSLFIISGGIRMHLRASGSPLSNTLTLAVATLLANFIGTTGAAMLFIRPLITTNSWRHYKQHTMIFFILLVCNIGGCLTALGDPPLFLGFLFGINFFWPAQNLLGPFLLVALPLLLIYFLYDSYLWKKEDHTSKIDLPPNSKVIAVEGSVNFLILGGIIASVLISGLWKPGIEFKIATVSLELQNIFRDVSIVGLSLVSLFLTHQAPRKANKFTWDPLLEVVKIFAGIFITATPVIIILDSGTAGPLASLINLVSHPDGTPLNSAYFWMTGALSAFLDNAPTYMIFFHMASGNPVELMTTLHKTLVAISTGAVFMGALTYIGNAPNFMVKSIAESQHIHMPSFFGYMLWSVGLLMPLFLIMSWLYF